MVVALNAPVDAVPDVPRLPVQPPEAVHALTLVDDHESVAVPPLVTLVGFAVRVTVGVVDIGVTATVAEALVLPPAPVQISA